MAMGIVSDKEFDSAVKDSIIKDTAIPRAPNSIESNSNSKEVEIIEIERGRGLGNVEVPNPLRNLIGIEAETEGRASALELAKQFGISPSSVSAYTKGATSTSTYDERPNESAIVQVREKITKRARNKMMAAIRHITEEKLGESKALDLSSIAKNMSAVVRNIEGDVPQKPTSGPTFVFYSPHFKKEEHFDVIQAKE